MFKKAGLQFKISLLNTYVMDKINIASQKQEEGIDQVNITINNIYSTVLVSKSLLSEANEIIKAMEYFKLKSFKYYNIFN